RARRHESRRIWQSVNDVLTLAWHVACRSCIYEETTSNAVFGGRTDVCRRLPCARVVWRRERTEWCRPPSAGTKDDEQRRRASGRREAHRARHGAPRPGWRDAPLGLARIDACDHPAVSRLLQIECPLPRLNALRVAPNLRHIPRSSAAPRICAIACD